MAERIDSIYCFDYTKKIGHYDSIRGFSLDEMTYIGLALSTPEIRVSSTPYSFGISSAGSIRIREHAVAHLPNLNEISKDHAVNSPKYILVCYYGGNERYFAYNEQFSTLFDIAFQYDPHKDDTEVDVNPYALQQNESTATSSFIVPQHPSEQDIPVYTATKTAPQTNNDTSPSYRKAYKKFPWSKILIGIGILILIILAEVNGLTKEPDAGDGLLSDVDSGLTAVSEPKSGTILSGREVHNGSKITIHAASGHSCVVKLKNRSGTERISFYVRAGDTATVGVPAEYLYVYFASGNTWYGKSELFGSRTSYSMDDKICDFTRYSWEYTLYPINDGNFSETPIDADDFK